MNKQVIGESEKGGEFLVPNSPPDSSNKISEFSSGPMTFRKAAKPDP